MAPVDVVHVIGALAAGGAERFVIDLVRALKMKGWQLAILALSSRQDAIGIAMGRQLRSDGIPYGVGPTVRIRAQSVVWYARQLSRLCPKIVHLHTSNTDLAHWLGIPMHWNRSRLVRTLHNTRLSRRLLESLAVNRLPVYQSIACSDAVRRSNVDRLGDSLVTIRNGVRFDWPIRDQLGSEAAKRNLGLGCSSIHFLCVGRMDGPSIASSQKGHDVLLDAWRRSALGECGARLHFVGNGPLRADLEKAAAGLNGVFFHGIRSDVTTWITAADCFVMPSRWEGMPIAGIEAAGTGIACIFSDIEPLRELGAPEARLFACGDSGQLAECLRDFHMKPTIPPRAAVEAFRRDFDIDWTATSYDRIYRSILRTFP